MSWLRSYLVTIPLIALATIGYGMVSWVIAFFDKRGSRQIAVAQAWSRYLLWVSGVKVTVEGIEKISPTGSYVFVANHLSYMDTPVILANMPEFRFLAKKGLFQIPFLGTHLKTAGHIPVPRGDARAAVKTMNLAAQIIRERKISILIFPEGGRSHDGELAAFQEGAALIAIRAGVPLVPMALKGTREILPFGSGHLRSGRVTLRIGDPIPTGELPMSARGAITEQLHESIARMLDKQAIHA
ncbi:MAG TPA: lysophospholipid acyltransferase family protein [Bryobacteraceae bacterium]|nr:lysophospholipid acyltransferase family protein [Bryobacteraceae bacterium]